ncbi:MAG: hypothetical protein MjAS7_1223 [Metallosphaera javensis (ex Sakai et al. 2022)]|nr:MAG: hypothetical protein MjAS7_1223 [Metallosphaera javensis (ex Sakai et al. 2022)]
MKWANLRRTLFPILLSLSLITYMLSLEKHGYIPLSIISSVTFWIGVGIAVPVPFYEETFLKVKKGIAYIISSVVYLTFHVLLYGIFYNVVLAEGLGQKLSIYPFLSAGFGVSVPTSPILFPYWVSTSLGFWVFIGPFESDTTPYSLFMGILLSLLLGANVSRLMYLRRLIKDYKRSLAILTALPTIAIVSGTSCCLSLPSIIVYIVGAASGTIYSLLAVLASPVFFVLSYFGLPLGSLVILYLSLKDMNKWISKIESNMRVLEKMGSREKGIKQ